jgi:hypothetical protein
MKSTISLNAMRAYLSSSPRDPDVSFADAASSIGRKEVDRSRRPTHDAELTVSLSLMVAGWVNILPGSI